MTKVKPVNRVKFEARPRNDRIISVILAGVYYYTPRLLLRERERGEGEARKEIRLRRENQSVSEDRSNYGAHEFKFLFNPTLGRFRVSAV